MKHIKITLKEFTETNQRIVLTGPAGSGKSIICEKFSSKGYKVINEPARELITYFEKYKPEYLPWNDRLNFQRCVEDRNIENWIENSNGVFDRSLVDEIAYRKYYGKEVPKELINDCKKYRYDIIFMFPPWEEIYSKDSVRKESFEVASGVYQDLLDAYKLVGYKPIEVPKLSIDERFNFILNELKL